MITDKYGIKHVRFGVGRLMYCGLKTVENGIVRLQLEFRTAPDQHKGPSGPTTETDRWDRSIPGVILDF